MADKSLQVDWPVPSQHDELLEEAARWKRRKAKREFARHHERHQEIDDEQ